MLKPSRNISRTMQMALINNVKRRKSRLTFIPDIYQKISGTWLFISDSLTGGTGEISPPPRYVADRAYADGVLGKRFIRTGQSVSYCTGTEFIKSGTMYPSTDPEVTKYIPNRGGYTIVTGNSLDKTLTLRSNVFPWSKARIYFLKHAGGGNFGVTVPTVTPIVSTDGATGEIGYIDIVNPNGSDTSDLVISNTSGGNVHIAGWLLDPENTNQNTVDVITLAVASKTTDDWNSCVNIDWWLNELGIEKVYANIGTNDGYMTDKVAVYNGWKTVINNIMASGIQNQDILLVRPNQTNEKFNGLYEDLAAELSLPFASIMRIWGDLEQFQENGWMSDVTHPNNTFNSILGSAIYDKELLDLESAAIIGIEPNWLTPNVSQTYVNLSSLVNLTGDFTVNTKLFWSGTSALQVFGSDTSTRNYLTVASDGRIRVRIDNILTEAIAGTVPTGWHYITVTRVGVSLTIILNGAIVASGVTSANAWEFKWLLRSFAGYSASKSIIAWVETSSGSGNNAWLLNQADLDLFVPALKGSVTGNWLNRAEGVGWTDKYYHGLNGDNIEYFTNRVQEYPWGNESWPS